MSTPGFLSDRDCLHQDHQGGALLPVEQNPAVPHHSPDGVRHDDIRETTETNPSSFRYDSLPGPDYIRLLAFQPPEESSDIIRCSLETYRLAEAPPYHAVSYVWGDGPKNTTILCGGRRRSLQVTQSLHTVLLALRKHRNGHFLFSTRNPDRGVSQHRFPAENLFWVDQICINQADAIECNQQVRLMQSIYQQASIVLISLGGKFDSLGAPVNDLLTKIASIDQFADLQAFMTQPKHCCPTSKELVEMGLPTFDQEPWSALKDMLLLPYFERVWVLQEAISAQLGLIIFEGGAISWRLFLDVMEWLLLYEKYDVPNISDLGSPYCVPHPTVLDVYFLFKMENDKKAPRNDEQPTHLVTLYYLVRNIRTLKSKLPKDKIFALAGIASDGKKVAIEYEKLDSQVFEDFARYTIGAQRNLNILSDVTLNDQDRGDTPSWVPRWDAPPPLAPDLKLKVFSAACRSEAVMDPQQESGVLKVKGKQLAVVTAHVLRLNSTLGGHEDVFAFLWEIVSWLMESGLIKVQEESSAASSCINRIKELAWCAIHGTFFDPHGVYNERAPSGDGADEKVLRYLSAYIATGLLLSIKEERLEALRYCIQLAQIVFEANLERLSAQFPTFPSNEPRYVIQAIKDFLQGQFPDLFKSRSSVDELIDRTSRAHDPEAAMAFSQSLLLGRAPMSIFITDGGAIGVGPPNLEKDDAICILYGGPVPYVLRPTSTPEKYTFIGDCYVHGWMHGEAFQKSGREQDTWFSLV